MCIPYRGKWDPEWVDSTYDPLKLVPLDWCDKLRFMCKVPSLPVARDTLVNEAMKFNCDYIFFLDTDHVFESPSQDPNIALKLLYDCINKNPESKDAKIVSGLYKAKQSTGFNNAMWVKYQDKGFTPVQQWTGNWLKVDVAGMGCSLIDIQLFKKLPKPWFRWETWDGMSEDFFFYSLAASHGYDTHIFTEVRLSHLGDLKIKSDGTVTMPAL